MGFMLSKTFATLLFIEARTKHIIIIYVGYYFFFASFGIHNSKMSFTLMLFLFIIELHTTFL
jgi:hypothetical protein